jgi:D-erythro-7,8-dihydroneopterin triphosphate epimerase
MGMANMKDPDRKYIICVKGLRLRTILGVYEHERHTPQDVVVHLALTVDAAQAAATDDLRYAVDYAALSHRIAERVERSQFRLLERLAEEILNLALAEPLVRAATVEVEKPDALPRAESVSVRLSRCR